MGSLNAFLHPAQAQNKKVIISEHFQEDGKPVPFEIRPITQQENEGLIKKATRRDKKGNEIFDRVSYNQALTAAAVVNPPLDNAELQKAYGVIGAQHLLVKMLYVGEFATLMQEVMDLSGLDTDINDEIEDAKNG